MTVKGRSKCDIYDKVVDWIGGGEWAVALAGAVRSNAGEQHDAGSRWTDIVLHGTGERLFALKIEAQGTGFVPVPGLDQRASGRSLYDTGAQGWAIVWFTGRFFCADAKTV